MARNLALSNSERLVLSYADEVFSQGSEPEEAMRNLPTSRLLLFNVRLAMPESVKIICFDDAGQLLGLSAPTAFFPLTMECIVSGKTPYQHNKSRKTPPTRMSVDKA